MGPVGTVCPVGDPAVGRGGGVNSWTESGCPRLCEWRTSAVCRATETCRFSVMCVRASVYVRVSGPVGDSGCIPCWDRYMRLCLQVGVPSRPRQE